MSGEIGALALWAGNCHFERQRPGEFFGIAAPETSPGKGADFVGFPQQIQGVISAFANDLKNCPKLIERRFLCHGDSATFI